MATDRFPHGWCVRCGVAYERGDRPQCECAGDPPRPGGGASFDEFTNYRIRVARLRFVPKRSSRKEVQS